MKLVLQDKYYNRNKGEEKYMVQTRSQTKANCQKCMVQGRD